MEVLQYEWKPTEVLGVRSQLVDRHCLGSVLQIEVCEWHCSKKLPAGGEGETRTVRLIQAGQ